MVIGEDVFPEPLEVPAELAIYAVAVWVLLTSCFVVEFAIVPGMVLGAWVALLVAGGDVP